MADWWPPALFHDVTLATIITALAGLGGWRLSARRDGREERDSLSRAGAEMLGQLRAELDRSTRVVAGYAGELDTLRAARYALEDIIIELRDHAVAARALVHEYERRLDMPQTVFPPLPRPGLAGPARAPPGAV